MTKPAAKTFGSRVREARTAQAMTLRELSRRVERAPSYINDIEYDRRVPAEAVVRKISEVLGLDVDVMMAAAGRLGEGVEEYIKSRPTAGALLRWVADAGLSEEELGQLLGYAEELSQQRPEAKRTGRVK